MTDRPQPDAKPSRVEVEFLEALRRRCPGHQPILEALGHLYTRAGRFQDGLQVDQELTRMRPHDPESWYNLACSYALVGTPDEALAALRQAIGCGYHDVDWMTNDDDLASLRRHPEFQKLVQQLKLKASARWGS